MPRKKQASKDKPAQITIVIPSAPETIIEGQVLESIRKQKKQVKFIIERGTSAPTNRNRGAGKAGTPFIAFINDHTIIEPDWSKKAMEFFERHQEVDMLGGPQLTQEGEGIFARATGYALASLFGTWGASSRYRAATESFNADETMLTTANLVFRRKVFGKVKFDETLYPGEDPRFIEDARLAGFRLAYDPGLVAYNRRRGSAGALARQMFRYAWARPLKESFAETLLKPYFFAPSIFVVYLLSLPFILHASWLLAAPALAYFVLVLLFSLYEAAKHRSLQAFPFLVAIFCIMHLSYGTGFIYGTADKISRQVMGK